MITAFEEVIGRPLPYVFKARRPGDAAQCWSDPSKASDDLGWKAERDLLVMLTDAWRWQSRNPQGYGTEKSAAKAPVAANSNTAMAS